MAIPLKVSSNGNSICLMLTRLAVEKLKVAKGDTVYLTDGPDGLLRLTAQDPDFDRHMKTAESFMRRYRNALKELAKK